MRPEVRKSARKFGGVCTGIMLLAFPLLAQYDPALEYQDRGRYHEGIQPTPVSGYDVELLSALVGSSARTSAWPEDLRLRFYLPEPEPAFITVRQLRSRSTYYWLDNVESRWRASAFNDFSWPTEPVLQKLTSVKLEDLGVVVRLGQELPGRREVVAPAILAASKPAGTRESYRFTFKTNGTAYVTAEVLRGDAVVLRRPQTREKAGSPFTVRWSARGQPEGEYRLALSGFFDDNTPLAKEVSFYHRVK